MLLNQTKPIFGICVSFVIFIILSMILAFMKIVDLGSSLPYNLKYHN